MKKITILDFSTGIVYIRNAEGLKDENGLKITEAEEIAEFYAKELDFRVKDTEFMISNEEINIK